MGIFFVYVQRVRHCVILSWWRHCLQQRWPQREGTFFWGKRKKHSGQTSDQAFASSTTAVSLSLSWLSEHMWFPVHSGPQHVGQIWLHLWLAVVVAGPGHWRISHSSECHCGHIRLSCGSKRLQKGIRGEICKVVRKTQDFSRTKSAIDHHHAAI